MMSLNVRPGSSFDNSVDESVVNAVPSRQYGDIGCAFFAANIARSDFSYVLLGEFSRLLFFSPTVPPLGRAITHIGKLIPKKVMVWITAQSVITAMQNPRDSRIAVCQPERNSMRGHAVGLC